MKYLHCSLKKSEKYSGLFNVIEGLQEAKGEGVGNQ